MIDKNKQPIRRAIISVSDKTGLKELGMFLSNSGIEILSTGGSSKALRESGAKVKDVSEYTTFPEILDGRVKTLHPKVHGGILAIRDNELHQKALIDNIIEFIDLVVVNLYPFEETVASHADFESCIENIDIGGPTLIRAAAKNHGDVTVIVESDDYSNLIAEMRKLDGSTSIEFRKSLAAKAFSHTARYDSMIANWFHEQQNEAFPASLTLSAKRQQVLRYGENPHLSAAVYHGGPKSEGVCTARQVQGKALSYNNLNDTDAAFELVAEFAAPAIAIIKHANPCGVALGKTLKEAYKRALECDPVSAFGGIIAINRRLDLETAQEISKVFAEVIIAPGADEAAINFLSSKKNLRLLLTEGLPDPSRPGISVRQIAGGYLAQQRDNIAIQLDDLKVVTDRKPTREELEDLVFAFRVCKHVKSNAIVYAKNQATVGIGAGQMSRVDSSRIAALKALDAASSRGEATSPTISSVVASDAFFPFADGLIAAAEAGVSAVIQPGGSVRDKEIIAAANERGLAMVFTGIRHFKH